MAWNTREQEWLGQGPSGHSAGCFRRLTMELDMLVLTGTPAYMLNVYVSTLATTHAQTYLHVSTPRRESHRASGHTFSGATNTAL